MTRGSAALLGWVLAGSVIECGCQTYTHGTPSRETSSAQTSQPQTSAAQPAPPQPSPPAPSPPAPSPAQTYPDGLLWFRSSAEQKAIYIETYRAAGAAVGRSSKGLHPGRWAVILDIDETVLDNSEYQKRLQGGPYDSKLWAAWVAEGAATALPGAKRFVDTVLDRLHGKVVFVTNRAKAQCDVTKANLHAVMLRYTDVLCKDGTSDDKNERFRRVENGEIESGDMKKGDESKKLHPLKVVAWVGDNIQDFPGLSQSAPGNPADYGVKYFVLPNPMYGSWTSLPKR